MKILLFSLVFLLSLNNLSIANDKTEFLNKITEKISNYFSNILEKDGLTEIDLKLKENNEPIYSILLLRNLEKTEESNFFTQLSIMNNDINNKERLTANLGLGKRFLSEDKSMMFGTNVFYDRDLFEKHDRASFGLEARAHMLDLNFNLYEAISNTVNVDKTDEKALSGYEFELSSQIPYMPWTKFHYTDYLWEKDKGSRDTKGEIYSLEMFINPSITVEASYDESDWSTVDDETKLSITYVYPPKQDRVSLEDGLFASNVFEKRDMSNELTTKVRRKNQIVVETQGTIVVTKK